MRSVNISRQMRALKCCALALAAGLSGFAVVPANAQMVGAPSRSLAMVPTIDVPLNGALDEALDEALDSALDGAFEDPLGTALEGADLQDDELVLPQVLSDQDADLYREIFTLQETGKWKAADRLIAGLSDTRLMGHVLAQRYMHPTAYRSRYKELRDWMAAYADHPEAKTIYKLALKRRPKNHLWPKSPATRKSSLGFPQYRSTETYRSTKRLNKKQRRQARRLKRQIRRNVLRTRLSTTEQLLNSRQATALLDAVEIDQGFADVAAAWYYFGRDEKAYNLASAAAQRSGEHVAMANWTAGLAAWRLGELALALRHFEDLALSDKVSGWNAAAGAYWAARANLKLRRPSEMSKWLSRAAKHPRTFYGLLALRSLGLQPRFEFGTRRLERAMLARLESEPASARALALMQIGLKRRAELELRGMNGWADPDMTRALLAVAEGAQMAELAFRLGNRLALSDHGNAAGDTLDVALYPIPAWQPESGFKVDRALVYALVRQESGFNPRAKSPDGARGLMQLMPRTASYMARDRGFRRSKRRQLFEPALNLELGQRYIAHLLKHNIVQGDLFRLTAAYNGGPGNLNKWQRKMDYGDDPLLFLESLPAKETRLFIERVLTNLWIYRMRLGQDAPSLDGIAAGRWPLYVPLDSERPELASSEPIIN